MRFIKSQRELKRETKQLRTQSRNERNCLKTTSSAKRKNGKRSKKSLNSLLLKENDANPSKVFHEGTTLCLKLSKFESLMNTTKKKRGKNFSKSSKIKWSTPPLTIYSRCTTSLFKLRNSRSKTYPSLMKTDKKRWKNLMKNKRASSLRRSNLLLNIRKQRRKDSILQFRS